jgi:A/G-specific adenine glycosylase
LTDGAKETPDISRRLLAWYDRNRRDLPWRPPLGRPGAPVNAYDVLVSEFMLQQTQVATVIPYFQRWMQAFPTISALAAADEQQVLRLWQGLGYYSRARNLLAAARQIVQQNRLNSQPEEKIPDSLEALQNLPGIGRYTAGAIASIAFGKRVPIVDGNVARVFCRLNLIKTDPRERNTHNRLWRIAEAHLPLLRCGEFNSALMELGATICTPRKSNCPECPLRRDCRAHAAGLQETIPKSTPRQPTPVIHRWTICLNSNGRWLIERRPVAGRWAGLWQFVTIPPHGSRPTPAIVRKHVDIIESISAIRRLGEIRHALTHRRYVFDVFTAQVRTGGKSGRAGTTEISTSGPIRRWVTLADLHEYPLPRPHLKVAEMLRPGAR